MEEIRVKIALSALLLTGAVTAMTAAPADARVVVGVGVGPGYVGPAPLSVLWKLQLCLITVPPIAGTPATIAAMAPA